MAKVAQGVLVIDGFHLVICRRVAPINFVEEMGAPIKFVSYYCYHNIFRDVSVFSRGYFLESIESIILEFSNVYFENKPSSEFALHKTFPPGIFQKLPLSSVKQRYGTIFTTNRRLPS